MTEFERTAFSTSRLLDFVSVKELQLQCGYGPEDWPLVALDEDDGLSWDDALNEIVDEQEDEAA